MERKVLVVERTTLFNLLGGYFNGFKRLKNLWEIIRLIEKNAVWMEKEATEHNPNFKQIIAYCSIINDKKSVFFYRRAKKDKDYPEKRLQGKLSVGVGGHIDLCDKSNMLNSIIKASLQREISEELTIGGFVFNISLIGFINDDDDVGNAHFGIYFITKTNTKEILPKSKEMIDGRLRSIKEIELLLPKAESWTRICFPVLRERMRKDEGKR